MAARDHQRALLQLAALVALLCSSSVLSAPVLGSGEIPFLCREECLQAEPVAGCFEMGPSIGSDGLCSCGCIRCDRSLSRPCDELGGSVQEQRQCVEYGKAVMDPNGAWACCVVCEVYLNTTQSPTTSQQQAITGGGSGDDSSGSGEGTASTESPLVTSSESQATDRATAEQVRRGRTDVVPSLERVTARPTESATPYGEPPIDAPTTPTGLTETERLAACQRECEESEPVLGCFEMGPGLDAQGICTCSCLVCDSMWESPSCRNDIMTSAQCVKYGEPVMDPRGLWQCCRPCEEYVNTTLREPAAAQIHQATLPAQASATDPSVLPSSDLTAQPRTGEVTTQTKASSPTETATLDEMPATAPSTSSQISESDAYHQSLRETCYRECGHLEPMIGCLAMGGDLDKDGSCVCSCLECSDWESPLCADDAYEAIVYQERKCALLGHAVLDPSDVWQCCRPCAEWKNQTKESDPSQGPPTPSEQGHDIHDESEASPQTPVQPTSPGLSGSGDAATNSFVQFEEAAVDRDALIKDEDFAKKFALCQSDCRRAEPMMGCFEMGPSLTEDGECNCRCTVCGNSKDLPSCHDYSSNAAVSKCVQFGAAVPDPAGVWQCCKPCIEYELLSRITTAGAKKIGDALPRPATASPAEALSVTSEQTDSTCQNVTCHPHRICEVILGQAVCSCRSECPHRIREVCGSDGRTYRNRCHLHRHACKHSQKISVLHFGQCEDSVEVRAP